MTLYSIMSFFFFFFKQKTAYDIRKGDWSSDVCSSDLDVGFFGGIKLGYVFGTGVFRPTVEGDFFYNGFKGGANFTLREPDGDVIRSSSVNSTINTGAFMFNFILRIAPQGWRFQPYFGAGVGVYYAESAGTDISTPH